MRTPGLRTRVWLALVGSVAATCVGLSVAAVADAQARRQGDMQAAATQAAQLDAGAFQSALRVKPRAVRIEDLNANTALDDLPAPRVLVAWDPQGPPQQYVFVGDDRPLTLTHPDCLVPHLATDTQQQGAGALAAWSENCRDATVGFALFTPVDPASGVHRWLVVVVLPDGAYPDPVPALLFSLALASGGLVLLSLVVAGAVAERVVRPLDLARRMAQAVAAGDRTVRLPARGKDEVATMSAAVNTMADDLTAQIGTLERANEAQRRFVADVAHELRTPTAALLASAEALANPMTRDEAAILVAPQLRRLSRLTEDLLEISRLDAGRAAVVATRVDLADVIADATSDLGEPAAVRYSGPGDVVVETDPARLRVIVRNLVVNALEHGRAPVTIVVEPEPSSVRVLVRDEGRGVPAELRGRVFDRFVRGDEARHGTGAGLGLALARENARLLGGEVSLEPDGRTFLLTLPRVLRVRSGPGPARGPS